MPITVGSSGMSRMGGTWICERGGESLGPMPARSAGLWACTLEGTGCTGLARMRPAATYPFSPHLRLPSVMRAAPAAALW